MPAGSAPAGGLAMTRMETRRNGPLACLSDERQVRASCRNGFGVRVNGVFAIRRAGVRSKPGRKSS